MTEVALLNPAQDAKVSKSMVKLVAARIDGINHELTTTVLDRETYLQKIGASTMMKRLLKEMQIEYDRNFEV